MILAMPTDRITVTLPRELVLELARAAKNRSRFVAEAIRHELQRRRREALKAALENPHPESAELAEAGWAEWAAGADPADRDLVDPEGGTAIEWSPEKGWVTTHEPRTGPRRPRRS
jgi:hypothetical protein